ncbi:hypothetical protein [Paraburkholderia flava]|uniref:hypothetical protein n=1 Tax=Paraburkholderia flava TaxID=2547393 RepID=UPI001060B219|nr:hypothetical protein [Paraburkholderia flava]
MRAGLKTRLEKLEGVRLEQGPNKVLHCKPDAIKWGGIDGSIEVWLQGYFKPGFNPGKGKISKFKGKFVVIPEYESLDAFEQAASQQQIKSLAFTGDRRGKDLIDTSAEPRSKFVDTDDITSSKWRTNR